MVALRAAKIAGIADDLPPIEIEGDPMPNCACWVGDRRGPRSTPRCSAAAVPDARSRWIHLTHLSPLPNDLGEKLRRFRQCWCPSSTAVN